MPKKRRAAPKDPADRLLAALASAHDAGRNASRSPGPDDPFAARLLADDLVRRREDGALEPTKAGRARVARLAAGSKQDGLDPFLAQHIPASSRPAPGDESTRVTVDEAESPLVWLARRKGRDGNPLVAPAQLQAGERLRADFTRAQMTPRVTSSWSGTASDRGGGARSSGTDLIDAAIAARQRVRRALDGVGPEFAGLLLDVCCFLKGLEEVERERQWPSRSAKVVLQLGLDRLARHYGFAAEAHGPRSAAVRTWLAADAVFAVDAADTPA